METTNYIEFKKERDLGTIISDTFKFIRENWKEYFLAILKIVGPFLLVAILVLVMYFMSFSKMFNNIGSGSDTPPNFNFLGSFFGWFFILMFALTILYTLLAMTSLYFVKSYIANSGKPEFNEVRENVLKNIWRFLGLGIITTITSIIGFYLCLLPGIYIGVIFSLAAPIMVFENKSIGDTLSHCFMLIKENWWNTFGCLVVIWLILIVLGQAFSIPALIYYFIKLGTVVQSGDPESIGQVFDATYITLNILSYVFQFILYSIPLIAIVFIYYDLNEQKNLTGTFEKIDRLGQ